MEKKIIYKRKYKYVSIKLFKEEGYILSDIIFIQYNVNIDNLRYAFKENGLHSAKFAIIFPNQKGHICVNKLLKIG